MTIPPLIVLALLGLLLAYGISLLLVAGAVYVLYHCCLAAEQEQIHRHQQLHQRLGDLEQRLQLIGLPDNDDDALALRASLHALMQHLVDDYDQANWWKHGGSERDD